MAYFNFLNTKQVVNESSEEEMSFHEKASILKSIAYGALKKCCDEFPKYCIGRYYSLHCEKNPECLNEKEPLILIDCASPVEFTEEYSDSHYNLDDYNRTLTFIIGYIQLRIKEFSMGGEVKMHIGEDGGIIEYIDNGKKEKVED